MTHVHRTRLAPPAVIRYWVLGLFAWGALLFVAGSAARNNSGAAATDVSATTIAPPAAVIPIHVFEETRLRVLRADMTGDFSALVPPNTCGHTSQAHAAGASCDAFTGVPGLARNNGAPPPWLADLPTH